MKYKIIACKVLSRELYQLSCENSNIIDIMLLKQALHNEPYKLKEKLQQAIDLVDAEDEEYDAILLGYGLCSNGIVGISSKKYKIVVPRGHDCITLLLGSKEKYKNIFANNSGGIYWYSPGWIEHTPMPGKERYEQCYNEYVEKFGEDNADYLMELEQSWLVEYKYAYYVDWEFKDSKKYIDFTRDCVDYLNWELVIEKGSNQLLTDLLNGNWEHERFLVVQPNSTIEPSFDESIIKEKEN